MKKYLKLPLSRVYALAAETNTAPEVTISALLSTLHAREMWAHYCPSKSTKDEAVFVYGANVPTPTRRRAGKGEA